MATFGQEVKKSVYSTAHTRFSQYITMRDGIKIAITVVLPKDRQSHEKLPVLLWITRYWREWELIPPIKWFTSVDAMNKLRKNFKPFLLSQGYALVFVDERGTGASFGHWPYPWAQITVDDMYDIVEWIVTQNWAAPAVAGLGISYLGTTAEILPACGHPAVKACSPKFNHPDPYTDITMPGGLYNRHFMSDWSAADLTLDFGKLPSGYPWISRLMISGVMPVDSKNGRKLLKQAQREHLQNKSPHFLAKKFIFRDEINPEVGISINDIGLNHYIPQITEMKVPSASYASWLDAGTAHAAIRRWLTFPCARLVYIGAWDHGGLHHASPYQAPTAPVDPSPQEQWNEHIRFFDHYLKKNKKEPDLKKEIHYYVMGAEQWRVSDIFPPKLKREKFYLHHQHHLTTHISPAENNYIQFTVNWSSSTGTLNRWWELHTLKQGTFVYPDFATHEKQSIIFDSQPLHTSIDIIGYPIAHLQISSSERDGAFIVYLLDVFPDGSVIYITEGTFRAIHRKISNSKDSKYVLPEEIPYHSFLREDEEYLVLDEKTELKFMLQPTAVQIKAGHKLRIAIACHDSDTFDRVPAVGTPSIKLFEDSFIDIPVSFLD